jgi:hypothetical protein
MFFPIDHIFIIFENILKLLKIVFFEIIQPKNVFQQIDENVFK